MERPATERSSWFNFFRSRRAKKAAAQPIKPVAETAPKRDVVVRRKPPPAVGIDLGTTNTAVAYVDRGTAKMIQNNAGNEITPSVVHFGETVLVGEEAVKRRKDSSLNTIYNIKRLIGRNHDDKFVQQLTLPYEIVQGADDRACVRVGEEMYSSEQISAIILQYMRNIAKKVLFDEPTEAVITVPANFSNAQREATTEAGRLAGLNVLQIVNEPTAAAIAFSVQNRENDRKRRVLVFDLGGGTFDVSIVEIEGLTTAVLASEGSTTLGGCDFDERIYEEAKTQFKKMKINIIGVDWTLMEACENAKKALSGRKTTRLVHKHHGGVGFDLSRDTFNDLCQDLFDNTLLVVNDVLQEASLNESQIDEILLVGGSTRIPRIREMIAKRFPKKPIRDDVEPELAVAKGAAILAASLSRRAPDSEEEEGSHSSSDEDSSTATSSCESSIGESFVRVNLLDVAPLHLGLRLDGDTCKVLIPKNTPIPFTAYDFLTNAEDDETTLEIAILEGNDEQASNNATLAKVEIDVAAKPAGKNHIKAVLSIDASGILSFSAIDMHTDKEVSVTFRSGRMDELVTERSQIRRELEERAREQFRERLTLLTALLLSRMGEDMSSILKDD